MYLVITANEVVHTTANYDQAREMARSISETTKDTVKVTNLPTSTVVIVYLEGARCY